MSTDDSRTQPAPSWHDDLCELAEPPEIHGFLEPSCRCGSRAYHLCAGCRSGQHLRHTPVVWEAGRPAPCMCDLEVA